MVRTAASAALVLACVLRVAGAPPLSAAQEQRGRADPTISNELAAWLFAVTRHTPGQQDDSVTRLARWSRGDVNTVLDELKKILDAVDHVEHPDTPLWSLPLYPYGVTDVPSLNRMLKRAAILHADVAFFNHSDSGYSLPPDDRRYPVVTDGRTVGIVAGTFHWAAGRRVLDHVRPSPAADDDVKLWYQVTAAMLQRVEDYAGLVPHLVRARELFPRDAVLALYDGTVHENLAEPSLQTTGVKAPQRAGPVPSCNIFGYCRQPTPSGAPDSERRQAETLFRQALQLDPALNEARIRLARSLGLDGRHAEAVAELQRALVAEPRALLRYYALALLGRGQQALGQRDAARIAYEEASDLYPAAQSPRLGLSQLARDAGDRVQAVAQLDVLREPAASAAQSDPWSRYGTTHVPDVFELVGMLAARWQQ